jgi:hypothetical protein
MSKHFDTLLIKGDHTFKGTFNIGLHLGNTFCCEQISDVYTVLLINNILKTLTRTKTSCIFIHQFEKQVIL